MKTLLALFLMMNMHSAAACGYAQNSCNSDNDCCKNCSCTNRKCGGVSCSDP